MIRIQENVSLAPLTTFGIGGPARFFCRAATEAELVQAFRVARERGWRTFVLGGGSNLLVSDAGFDGLVVQVAISRDFTPETTLDRVEYLVPAGVDWDEFVRLTAEAGLSGVECLAGIPGLVGGTPVQNVGAYGQEVAGTIVEVRALDVRTLNFVDLPASACGFAYRRSIFNSTEASRYVVTAVRFAFDPEARPSLTYADLERYFAGRSPTPIEVYHAVWEIRGRKGMVIDAADPDSRSAGSFFKNPLVTEAVLERVARAVGLEIATVPHWTADAGCVKLPAAWLLNQAGFHKGYVAGAAGISSKHSLALINRGGAKYADVAALRDRILAEVERRFGVLLEQEPVQVGD